MIALLAVTAVCHVAGHGLMAAPDNSLDCTPGDWTALTRAEVCDSKPRPYLRVAVRRDILARYGVPGWTGADGELDHRVPFFLGGATDRENLWPEAGSIPNLKDRLESYTYRRVCVRRDMRPRTARRLFLADWRHAYRAYHCATGCRP